jgi:hypothetical protein
MFGKLAYFDDIKPLGFPRSAAIWLSLVVGTLCCLSLRADSVQAPEPELSPRNLNVWGRFDPGTWKKVRIVTETINDRGAVVEQSTTETRTTLLRADTHRLALKIEATVEVAGKRFESPPQVVEYGYYGESPNDRSETKLLGSEQLVIEGRQVPCRIQQVVATSGQQQQVTKMYLSDDVEPFVLKRETTVIQEDGKTGSDFKTEAEVTAVDRPYYLLHENKRVAFERTIQRTSRGTNITFDWTCADVPGGIVARTSEELDGHDHVVRRSRLELVDYHVVDDDDDSNNSGSSPQAHRQSRRARRHQISGQ